MKIGILGGSFDPPHIGHIYISLQAKEQLNLDVIWLMPCGKHPFLKDLTPALHRLAMLRMMEQEDIKISEYETQKESFSYTIDTLKELTKDSANEYYWIIGSDQLPSFQKWKNWKEIIQNYKIVIAPRGNNSEELTKLVKKYLDLKTIPENITVMDTTNLFVNNLSSSFIRERVQLQKPITYLVPDSVERYIAENNLYEKK
jgi:nicotinate-nucleotide adenylyltransferase